MIELFVLIIASRYVDYMKIIINVWKLEILNIKHILNYIDNTIVASYNNIKGWWQYGRQER